MLSTQCSATQCLYHNWQVSVKFFNNFTCNSRFLSRAVRVKTTLTTQCEYCSFSLFTWLFRTLSLPLLVEYSICKLCNWYSPNQRQSKRHVSWQCTTFRRQWGWRLWSSRMAPCSLVHVYRCLGRTCRHRLSFFWYVTRRWLVVSYWRFGKTYLSHLQGSRGPRQLYPWRWEWWVTPKRR
jgi:hypothetical protein